MEKLIVLVLLVGCVLADEVQFKDCGSKTGAISKVEISPCPQLPCKLKRGSAVDVSVTFKSSIDSKTSKAVVHGKIAGIPLPFPIPNNDGCKSNVKCPITKGDTDVYKNKIEVSKSYPKVQVIVQWELRDADNNDLFCFTIPAEISD